MSGVLRLTYLYFAAGAWRRWLLLAGALAIGVCLVYPPTNARWEYLPLVAFAGVTALFLGGSLMPVLVNRLTSSHLGCVLPAGRTQLLVTAFLTIAIIALPLPVLIALTMMASFPNYSHITLFAFIRTPFFVQMYVIVFWVCSVVYFVQCLFSNLRSPKSLIPGLVLAVGLIAIPQRLFMPDVAAINPFPLALVGGSWASLALYVWLYPFWRNLGKTIALQRGNGFSVWQNVFRKYKVTRGRELDVVLGLRSRWIQALSFGIVVALEFAFMRSILGQLYYFSMFAVIAGAVAGIATVRSRWLWLRRPWSRDEMFMNIERFAWRQMGLALGVLVFWFAVIGIRFELSLERIAVGAMLIALVFSVCLYLGLLQTRGMRWSDASVALAMVVPAMAIAAYASNENASLIAVILFEALLLFLNAIIRSWAKRRWHVIDWMMCRPQRFS